MSGASCNVRSYEFGDYEIVCCCVIGGIWKVRGEGFFFFFIYGVFGGGEEAVICYGEGVVIEEI